MPHVSRWCCGPVNSCGYPWGSSQPFFVGWLMRWSRTTRAGLAAGVRIFVATQPVDGRKGPDSLMALARDVLRLDPLSGHLFVSFPSAAAACASCIGTEAVLRCGPSDSKRDASDRSFLPMADWQPSRWKLPSLPSSSRGSISLAPDVVPAGSHARRNPRRSCCRPCAHFFDPFWVARDTARGG